MWDFSLGKTFGIMAKTMPFIVMRMIVFFGITLAYIFATGTGAGIGYGIGSMGTNPETPTVWGGIAGFGLVSIALYWFREYILYLVKAGHIAVMVEILDGRAIPGGRSQIGYAQQIVRERFLEVSILFAVDQLVKGILRVITGTIMGIATILPIPALQQVAKAVNAVLTLSLTYVDEIILAYNIRVKSTNPWETSKDALILYGQNLGKFVKNAIWLAIFMWLIAIAIFLLMLAPAAAIFSFFPGWLGQGSFVIAIVFAWSFKAAFLEPFAIASLMQVYFKVIEGQTPDPVWDERLTRLSRKFVDLKNRAAAWVTGKPAAGAKA